MRCIYYIYKPINAGDKDYPVSLCVIIEQVKLADSGTQYFIQASTRAII